MQEKEGEEALKDSIHLVGSYTRRAGLMRND